MSAGHTFEQKNHHVVIDGIPLLVYSLFKNWILAGGDEDPASVLVGDVDCTFELKIPNRPNLRLHAFLIAVHNRTLGTGRFVEHQMADNPHFQDRLDGLDSDIPLSTITLGGRDYVLICSSIAK